MGRPPFRLPDAQMIALRAETNDLRILDQLSLRAAVRVATWKQPYTSSQYLEEFRAWLCDRLTEMDSK